MKLNKLEFLAMNNPVRELIREKYEMKLMSSQASGRRFGSVLEIGCGNGGGTRLIQKYFSPENIEAVDYDDKMINKASKRNSSPEINFQQMDAANLTFPDQMFDAVFDFGIIHHIPNWRLCINELKRVLKPEGELLIADLSSESFSHGTGRLWKILTDHPYETMFTAQEFVDYLEKIGFRINHFHQTYPFRMVRYFFINARLPSV